MKHFNPIALILGTLAASMGCVDMDLASQPYFVDDYCPPVYCGHNDEAYNDDRFGQFRLDHVANPKEVTLIGVEAPDGQVYELDAVNGRLVGRDPATGAVAVSAANLVGGKILLEAVEGTSIVDYEINIQLSSSSNNALPEDWTLMNRDLWNYFFTFRKVGNTQGFPLCKGSEEGERAALVTKGESYNPNTGVFTPGTQWLNFACGTLALNKMIRLGYAKEVAMPAWVTSTEQREATVRMIRADYLGDGTSYTESGHVVWWQNQAGWVTMGTPDTMSATAVLEAYWTVDGAACLNAVRVPTLVPAGGFAVPPCSSFDPNTQAWEWVTYIEP